MDATHVTSKEATEPAKSASENANNGDAPNRDAGFSSNRIEAPIEAEHVPVSSYPTYVAIQSQSDSLPLEVDSDTSAGPSSSRVYATPELHGRAEERMSAEDAVRQMSHSFASFMGTNVRETDAKLQATLESQRVLEDHIDRLMEGLDKLLEDVPLPLLTQHIARLSALQRRVRSLTANVHTVQGRINNMNRALSNRATKTLPGKPTTLIKVSRLWPSFTPEASAQASTRHRSSSDENMQALPLLPPPPRLPHSDHGAHSGTVEPVVKEN